MKSRHISISLAKALLRFKTPAAIVLAGSALCGQTRLWRSNPNIVTLQELQHSVPGAAQREMRQAERALALGREQEAIVHMKSAVRLDPAYVAARNNLAVHLLPFEPESAIGHLEEAARINPHHPILFANLAVAYCLVRKFDAAELAARRSLSLDRGGAWSRFILGMVLVDAGKLTAEALDCLEQTKDLHPAARVLLDRVSAALGGPAAVQGSH